MSGFESPHAAHFDPGWLVRELRAIVRVLAGVVGCIRGDIAMSDSVTPQPICDDPSGSAITHSEQALEESNCCLSISATLKVHVNDFTVLIDCTPKIVLFALDPNEDLIDEEALPVSLVAPSKSPRLFGPELDAPQSDRFVTDRDSAFGHEIFNISSTQIEAVIEPDRVLNDLRRKTVTFVH